MKFIETIPTNFFYIAWNIDLRTIGPFVRKSKRRNATLKQLNAVVDELQLKNNIDAIRIFESTFIPPLKNAPQFDIVLLIDSKQSAISMFEDILNKYQITMPALMVKATNVARFGDTDNAKGPVLLNHFIGKANPETATETWKAISQWYESALGVSNSTLLKFNPESPFVLTNYAVIPGSVVHFMANQLLRPSFYSNVTSKLQKANVVARPVFLKRIM